MKTNTPILLLALTGLLLTSLRSWGNPTQQIDFEFIGHKISLPADNRLQPAYPADCEGSGVVSFAGLLPGEADYPLIRELLSLRKSLRLNDWLYYQLIRRTAQELSPKSANYFRYTIYKWWMLVQSGFDARLRFGNNKLLFYVQCEENIYNIPAFRMEGKQYVCLNYHDYGSRIDFDHESFTLLPLPLIPEKAAAFSYRISELPSLGAAAYRNRTLQFAYNRQTYEFTVKVTPQLGPLFANYPVVDYETCFNTPLSPETYHSLIPLLRRTLKGLKPTDGVDYLMHFTRYAFLFEQDTRLYGKEKRLSPEQTLLFEQSDCEDRAALFFYLVKELYNLPMLVLAYPDHVTVAVKFSKPVGPGIVYNGEKYTLCEPTPQATDLRLGETLPSLAGKSYEVVYAYQPTRQ